MNELYKNPRYYEIAFSFRNIAKEVDTFEECIRYYSHIPVKHVLELACGNSPHMEELLKRKYDYTGIDTSSEMLEYSRQKAAAFEAAVSLFHGNMVDFSLDKEVDFAYVMLGSLYVRNGEELVSHFDSVSHALKRGGLYFLDWCVQFEPLADRSESSETLREGILVKMSYAARTINSIEQTVEETVTLDVAENGEDKRIVGRDIKKAIYPQEFLNFIASRNDFEFVGWWNNWDLSKPLRGNEKIVRPITIVRRLPADLYVKT